MLFVRWTEFSAFSPVMQLHSAINLGPWDYGAEALDIFRRYSRLHMSLFPYRYAAAQESARTGMPLMRALVLFHPARRRGAAATDEYYFGPDLLVAPVVTPGTQRSVHLPEGEWLDYWSGARYTRADGPRGGRAARSHPAVREGGGDPAEDPRGRDDPRALDGRGPGAGSDARRPARLRDLSRSARGAWWISRAAAST